MALDRPHGPDRSKLRRRSTSTNNVRNMSDCATSKNFVIWGGTGHCRVVHEALAGNGYRLLAIGDRHAVAPPLPDVPLLVGRDSFQRWLTCVNIAGPLSHVVAIGGGLGRDRLDVAEWLTSLGLIALTVVHRAAFVADGATLGPGSHVLAGACLGAAARVGSQVIINTMASVDHDCKLYDGVHIGPGATLAGEVIVEECAFVGAGAVILPHIRIGRDAIVGAGAVVTRDVAPATTVVGIPARPH